MGWQVGALVCALGLLLVIFAAWNLGSRSEGDRGFFSREFGRAAKLAKVRVDAHTQSLEQLINREIVVRKKDPLDPINLVHVPPLFSINFGTEESTVAPSQYKDYGLPYNMHEEAGYMKWGWNCDLHAIHSTRERRVPGSPELKAFVIPDRHNKCVDPLVWRISIPAGDYTVRISSADLELPAENGAGCIAQGVRLGDLPTENLCDQGEDNSCYILPHVTVHDDDGFFVAGSYATDCKGLNYIEFYQASNATAIALSTFVPLEANVVDPAVLAAEPELNEFLKNIANENLDVIAASVNEGYIDFAMNWLCSISKMNIQNFFLIATDDASYEWFHSRGYPTYHVMRPSQSEQVSHAAVEYGTVAYQELILQRTKLVNKVLRLGYNILLCDVDAVWLSNPVPYLSHGYDIQAQPENDGRLCGGFMFMLSTEKMQELWQAVTTAHQNMVTKAEHNHGLDTFNASEQEILLRLMRSAHLKVKRLDSDLFPHGLKYFGAQMTLRSGMDLKKITPVVVHNNYVIGHDKKLTRFEYFHLWFVKDRNHGFECNSKMIKSN